MAPIGSGGARGTAAPPRGAGRATALAHGGIAPRHHPPRCATDRRHHGRHGRNGINIDVHLHTAAPTPRFRHHHHPRAPRRPRPARPMHAGACIIHAEQHLHLCEPASADTLGPPGHTLSQAQVHTWAFLHTDFSLAGVCEWGRRHKRGQSRHQPRPLEVRRGVPAGNSLFLLAAELWPRLACVCVINTP